MRQFGKDEFWNCLRIFLVEETRKIGKDKFWKIGKDKFWNCEIVLEHFMEFF